MDVEATFAIILDDSEDRDTRLDAIDDLSAWIDSDGYIPTRLMNRVRSIHPYGQRASAQMWLDGFATALQPNRTLDDMVPNMVPMPSSGNL